MTAERELVTDDLHVVVLAAGKGTRMRSSMPKVLHRAGGLPLVEWVIRLARSMHPQSITVVLGHGAADVESWFGASSGVAFVRQEPQLGTGHAVLQTRPHLQGRRGTLLLLSADVPLLARPSLERLVACRKDTGAGGGVATAGLVGPTG
jgi:bifunctional N-acetylglucosamine-1-phosphate-uridyltransferase/glucosamine-1-phosphate-acetyltransferase GlmU-like protein